MAFHTTSTGVEGEVRDKGVQKFLVDKKKQQEKS